jgi:hypothetical protein
MFSLPKIIAFVGLIAAVWYGFRLVDRLDKARRRKAAEPMRGEQRAAQGARHDRDGGLEKDGVVDLVEREDGSYSVKDDERRG